VFSVKGQPSCLQQMAGINLRSKREKKQRERESHSKREKEREREGGAGREAKRGGGD